MLILCSLISGVYSKKQTNKPSSKDKLIAVTQTQDLQVNILACWAQHPFVCVCAPSPLLTGPFGCVCLALAPWLLLTDGLSFRFFPSTHLLL